MLHQECGLLLELSIWYITLELYNNPRFKRTYTDKLVLLEFGNLDKSFIPDCWMVEGIVGIGY